jgi:hypothetical protein
LNVSAHIRHLPCTGCAKPSNINPTKIPPAATASQFQALKRVFPSWSGAVSALIRLTWRCTGTNSSGARKPIRKYRPGSRQASDAAIQPMARGPAGSVGSTSKCRSSLRMNSKQL